MKCYLCKYIPPRADFLATMTAEERDWMKQHGAFLDELLEQGLIVAHGPVADPNGGYGVSLYRIADDQNIEAITSNDPIVRNGAGHYEHHPMPHLRTRD
ncbi:YciI family protein [Terricaulis silvestris]|uniref:YCII-related domain protein n=1 Tax=Terricaulis silvestris TaxID=2686094 RepID=A0A6I6MUI7_9CAUL|nr:YciI family protein [Terricaulis silvestris]QGZ96134.1 YCII-related domain protein [Terricaulis silvestris]